MKGKRSKHSSLLLSNEVTTYSIPFFLAVKNTRMGLWNTYRQHAVEKNQSSSTSLSASQGKVQTAHQSKGEEHPPGWSKRSVNGAPNSCSNHDRSQHILLESDTSPDTVNYAGKQSPSWQHTPQVLGQRYGYYSFWAPWKKGSAW